MRWSFRMKKDMKRLKIVCIYVSVCLCTALALPVASRAQGSSTDTLYLNKTATYDYATHMGEITLESFIPGEMQVVQEAKAIEAILVMDFSGSMADAYSSSNTFTKTVIDKIYDAQNLYWKSGSSYKLLSNETQNRDVQVYDSNHNPIRKNYKGTDYDLKVLYIYDSTNSSYPCCWAYITVNGKRVFIRHDGSAVEESGTTTVGYWKYPTGEDGYYITPARGKDRPILIITKEQSGNSIQNRLDALQAAAGHFIDLIADHAAKTGKTDRVATVVFQANNEAYYPKLYSENSSNYPTDYLNPSKRTYLMECPTDLKRSGVNITEDSNISGKTYVAKRFVDLSTQGAASLLKFSISNTQTKGSTPVNLGVTVAKTLMDKDGRTDEDVARYIIVFTDGEPTTIGGSGSAWTDVATPTVKTAYDLKNSTTKPTSIYTIYCNSSTPSTTSNIYKFLDHLSSNYPTSKTYSDNTTRLPDDDARYFKTATQNLEEIFEQIAEEIIVETNHTYDTSVTMKDFVNNNYFQFPENSTVDDIRVYEQLCTGYDSVTGEYTFSSTLTDITSSVGVALTRAQNSSEHDLVEIYNYDYSANWCGMDISVSPAVPHGAKLVVKLPFTFKGGIEVSGALNTNTSNSGIYLPQIDETTQQPIRDPDTGKPIPVDTPEWTYISPQLKFCTVTITRSNLDPNENAVYDVSDKDGNFVCRVALVGIKDQDTVSKSIYGLPGDTDVTYTVTETNWNWAYSKDGSASQTKEVSNPSQTVVFPFSGSHLNGTGSDPAEKHNHDEKHKRNIMILSN